MTVTWHGHDATSKALDGMEEWAMVEWRPQAYKDAPKKNGTMANSLGHERDDANKLVRVGGGGEAKAYILKQEMDRSLHHEVGKSGFIRDSCNMKAAKLPEYVKKHITGDGIIPTTLPASSLPSISSSSSKKSSDVSSRMQAVEKRAAARRARTSAEMAKIKASSQREARAQAKEARARRAFQRRLDKL